jgi:hypothetical protein
MLELPDPGSSDLYLYDALNFPFGFLRPCPSEFYQASLCIHPSGTYKPAKVFVVPLRPFAKIRKVKGWRYQTTVWTVQCAYHVLPTLYLPFLGGRGRVTNGHTNTRNQ